MIRPKSKQQEKCSTERGRKNRKPGRFQSIPTEREEGGGPTYCLVVVGHDQNRYWKESTMRGAGKKEWRGGGRTEGGYEHQHQSSSFPPPTWIYLTTYLLAIPCPLSPAQPVGVAPEFVSWAWYLGILGDWGGRGEWDSGLGAGKVDWWILQRPSQQRFSLFLSGMPCVRKCMLARAITKRCDQTRHLNGAVSELQLGQLF